MTSTMRFDKWENSLGQPYGTVLQVVSVTKTDTFTMSSSTFTDVTGLSVSITPRSSSSKILVNINVSGGGTPGFSALIARLMRGSTPIAIGDAAGGRPRTTIGNTPGFGDTSAVPNGSFSFLDSPATTSPLTYTVQIANNGGSQIVYINRSPADTDNASFSRSVSSITLMEIAQ
jgi:hypothetical protein